MDNYNNDPNWIRYILKFESLIAQISKKVTSDLALQEDCAQEARIALLEVFPEKIDGHENFIRGDYTEEQWHANIQRYCGNVIRNSILDYLNSYRTGNWYVGRSKKVKDTDGSYKKIVTNPRFSSLDELVDFGMQLDENGNIVWEEVSTDGLLGADQ